MNQETNFDPADIEKNKTMAGLAYFIFFLPLIVCPDSKYGRFHANQALNVLIFYVAGAIVFSILSAIFIAAFAFGVLSIISILSTIYYLALAVLGIWGLINGFTGKAMKLPVIGGITIIKW